MKNIVIYKAVFNSYDNIEEISDEFIYKNIDYYVISDKYIELSKPWNLILVDDIYGDPVINNRFFKFNLIDKFKEYEYSIYLDGNISVVGDINQLVSSLDVNKEVFLYEHPYRGRVKDEVTACFIYGKINIFEFINLRSKKYSIYLDNKYKLYECGVLIRTKNINNIAFSELFEIFKSKVRRDQIYFPHIMEKYNIAIDSLGISNIRTESEYFQLKSHLKRDKFLIRLRNRFLLRIYKTLRLAK
ncbi:hypothetical protein HWA77_17890 [Photobacterium damselae subsp. damselae]|uniref:Glycosyl transferase n=1 Tax=Photobacterium damselae subsp. damselae TaxID=85581 RepID=A0A850R0G4_PHODD|nr:hypothetical protein [Photobacterium damselae subsp. damselae]